MTTRDEFEIWASQRSNLSQDSDGQYYSPLARASWDVWQARQQEIDALKAEIEKLKSNDHIADISKMVFPPDQLEHKLDMVPADNQDALDAARYRYLRDVSCEEEGDGALVVIFRGDWTISIEQAELCGEVLDATIDAQMQHTTEPEE